ncbi:zinc finger protein 704 [Dermochelys coriacea]|uniref:zinc finger protein 704 n=1 Tax=Dermochelys coriacea TaxID=27794 RepID=UPI001CA88F76|nr:zinc finger protein 704 [Dermochelys coriacea]XP_043363615.1 zinc finger protein 704 [Dermochelys coriacea]XP_043363616.1 zinc finger protein 704 [Dermochelys coriacea]XP_043363617.1 zinc finger protein 704 [Dermochelys coriacea]XP_043363618.1 zinc finger protein 704 [Dermochelys coriacea]XP_043363619.1 zinc finger protein 704 [Dermochelys coriacea]XP_043363620.1 zinc finger protein 704 [Dermochelys coriacea]
MQARRLAKRSSLGSRRRSVPLAAPAPDGGRAPKPESGCWRPPRREGSAAALEEEEEEEDEDVVVEEEEEDEGGLGSPPAPLPIPAKGSLKAGSIKRETTFTTFQHDDLKSDISQKLPDQQFLLLAMREEDLKTADTKKTNRIHEHEKENTRSVCLLEQKRKVVSSNIDVPPTRKSSEELDMDKVTAAMVLTSLSTSPLVHSPPVRPNESLNGSWKEGGFVPSSTSSSGYWSWSAPSDQSNPSTPSPPLSADSFKPFRMPSQPDDSIDEAETSNLLFDEPIPRKRKNSMKVMFKCLWKNCGKVLSSAAGIQKHIRTIHLGRVGESDYSDGEEDFYYTEIRLNTDSVADGLSSLSPVSPSLGSPPAPFPTQDANRPETSCAKTETKLMTPLSRSAPTNLYLVHTDHAYQATPPVNIPGSTKFTPNGRSFSISWQSPPVTFTGIPVSPTHNRPAGTGESKQQTHTVLSSPPRVSFGLRKPRGEGKKCRKVYGMENRDMWCTACRWKKACQRFID